MSETLLAVIVGGALTTIAGIATEYFRGRREWRLDREKRADDRRLAHDAFQRDTLIGLQEVMVDWARAGAERHMTDLEAYRRTGQWGRNLVGEEQSAREMATNRTLTMLRSRVDDQELRDQIDRCTAINFRSIVVKSYEEADALQVEQVVAVKDVLTRAGDLFRDLW